MAAMLRVIDMGLLEYGAALELQRSLRQARIEGEAPDTLLLLEHPPTVTLGRRADPSQLLVSSDDLERRGFRVQPVERGGKATYHGPGQLVGYPIVSLRALRLSVPRFVWSLEEAMIVTLAEAGLAVERRDGYPGVWARGRKIGAIGIHLKHWVSIHGLALNVDPDLSHFETIIPCGIDDAEVTSMARELGLAPEMAEVNGLMARHLAKLLGHDGAQWIPRDALTASRRLTLRRP